jgi:hypothetical protein
MTYDLDPSVLSTLEALADAIGDVPPPCWAEPDRWFASNAAPAIAQCLNDCHALPECANYAAVCRPEWGVWAGQEASRVRRGGAWVAPDLQPGVEVA